MDPTNDRTVTTVDDRAPEAAAVGRRTVLAAGMIALTGVTATALTRRRWWHVSADPALDAATAPSTVAPPVHRLAPPMASAVTGIDLPALPLAPATTVDGVQVVGLRLAAGQRTFVEGHPTPTWGIDQDHLGPVVRVRRGDRVRMDVRNDLSEPTTLHWHGMHVPAAVDGGPFQVIEPSTTWSAEWEVRQSAGTMWFHPHLMGTTRDHVLKGLVGMLLVDDEGDAGSASLPHELGVDDVPIILQEHRLNDRGQLGAADGERVVLVNGSLAPRLALAAGRARLRLVNASDSVELRLALADGSDLLVVGVDGGRLTGPLEIPVIGLGPGERVELVVTGNGTLVALGPDDASRDADVLLEYRSAGPPAAGVDATFGPIELPDAAAAVVTRHVQMAYGGPGMTILAGDGTGAASATTGGGHAGHGSGGVDHLVPLFTPRLDTTEIWEVENATAVDHYFHVHDVQFRVLDRDDAAPLDHELGRKDTVRVAAGSTVRIALAFTDYADPAGLYMLHCHMLSHEDQGMMASFAVIP